MNDTLFPLALLVVPGWPLLVAGAVATGLMRPLALRLAPWATLPALAVAALPDTGLQLPGAMLGGVLVLDVAGRVLLLLISALWLVTGLLARARLHAAGSNAFAVLLMLALAGGLGMALAGDALSFYAASTLAGYALYGALVHGADAPTRQAGRVLVIVLVVSDLLVFELLLMLAQGAGVDFASLRQSVLSADNRGLILGLLVAGFGAKAGLLGVHFWLALVFVTAATALRPALVAYMFGAGLLGGLRLLPLGEIGAPGAGEVLRWLAWTTLAYAGIAGLLQSHSRSMLAYAAIALGGLWLAVLSVLLQQPRLWPGMAETLAIALLQSGFALTALLLIDRAGEPRLSPWRRRSVAGVSWLAVLLLATAPAGIAQVMTDRAAVMPVYWAMVVIAVLAASSLLRGARGGAAAPANHDRLSAAEQALRSGLPMPGVVTAAAGLTVAGVLVSLAKPAGAAFSETAFAALIVLASVPVAGLSARFLVPRLPALPAGDVLAFLSHGLVLARHQGRRLADWRLMRWSGTAQALARRLGWRVTRSNLSGWLESALNRWPSALVLVLLLGLLVAWMSGL